MNFLHSFPLFIRRSVVEEICNIPNLKPSKRTRVSGVEKLHLLSSLSLSRYSELHNSNSLIKHLILCLQGDRSHLEKTWSDKNWISFHDVSFSSSFQRQPSEHQLVRSLSFGTGKLRHDFAVLSYKVVSKITEATLKNTTHDNCCLLFVLPKSYSDQQSSAYVWAYTVWSYKHILNALCTMIWFKDNLKLSPASSADLNKGYLPGIGRIAKRVRNYV